MPPAGAQGRAEGDGPNLPQGSGGSPRDLSRGASGLLVHPPGRHLRAQPLGQLQPRPSRPTPVALLREGDPGRHVDEGEGHRASAGLLDPLSQPTLPAEGGDHRRGEQHLHRLRPHQPGRCEGGRLRRSERTHLPDPGRDRGDAPPATKLHDPGEQEEPRPLHPEGPGDHQDRLRPALGLQHRRHHPGDAPPGQEPPGRPQRRGQRLRGDRSLRKGELHPHGLLQSDQDS
ncbi:MAG: hypothetical protein BWY86_01270 [Candidatus Aminicenantes bacterium ADurb.Bin508]|nr:MAG: hypothetical protein BWY86_01270 [Candidatus Aminicenantes bacterium ADurb.Bin508]